MVADSETGRTCPLQHQKTALGFQPEESVESATGALSSNHVVGLKGSSARIVMCTRYMAKLQLRLKLRLPGFAVRSGIPACAA